MGSLAATLAGAQAHLYEASRTSAADPGSVEEMRQAMECLARALQLLQDLRSGSGAVEVASKSVAGSLATLYGATQGVPRRPSVPPSAVAGPGVAAPSAALAGRRDPGVAPPPTMDDRRRKTIQLQLDQVLDFQGDTHFYTGLSGSIGEGGIFIATFDQKPINAKIAVSFTLPTGETIITRGLVRWLREYNPANPDVAPGMGVRFFELTAADKAAIERYLEKRAPIFYDDE